MELKIFIERALDALQQNYYRALEGLAAPELSWQPGPNANSIGFEDCPSRTPYPESSRAVAFFRNYTVGHMFCQLIGETNQHLGQVAYIRGLQKHLGTS
ncbi:MAG: hypothetical protein KAI93_04215 [Desulfobacterales bacterium]|nr:hypothetical protein [Desulfobacterales bacterium]